MNLARNVKPTDENVEFAMAGFAPKQPSQAEKTPEDIRMERRVLWKLDLTVLVLLGITYLASLVRYIPLTVVAELLLTAHNDRNFRIAEILAMRLSMAWQRI
jgi:hypothetical protein